MRVYLLTEASMGLLADLRMEERYDEQLDAGWVYATLADAQAAAQRSNLMELTDAKTHELMPELLAEFELTEAPVLVWDYVDDVEAGRRSWVAGHFIHDPGEPWQFKIREVEL